ncbi:hypothetical protein ABGB07_43580 [Micromonosporaceae bacterium B7E4]
MPGVTAPPMASEWRDQGEVQMLYQSVADFCAKYAETHKSHQNHDPDYLSELGSVKVVSETPDTARVEALRYASGHAPDAGFWDAYETVTFVLVRRHDGWRVHSETLDYDYD